MIVLSLVLVIVAAVTLIAGFFQDESLTLIYVAIVSCVLAMAALGVGVLQRKRSTSPASDGGYGRPESAGGARSSAPARSSSSPASSSSITPVRPKEPIGGAARGRDADEGSGDDAQVIVRKATAADAAKRSAGKKATKKAVAKKAVAKKVARRPAAEQATDAVVSGEPTAVPQTASTRETAGTGKTARSGPEKAATAKKAPQKSSAGASERTSKSAAKRSSTKKAAAKTTGGKAATRKAASKKAATKKTTAAKSTAKKTASKRSSAGGKAEARQILASIKGLGPAKQDAVLSEFGSVAALRQASVEQLSDIRGIGEGLAEAIKDAVR